MNVSDDYTMNCANSKVGLSLSPNLLNATARMGTALADAALATLVEGL